jgi:hypothetical protein
MLGVDASHRDFGEELLEGIVVSAGTGEWVGGLGHKSSVGEVGSRRSGQSAAVRLMQGQGSIGVEWPVGVSELESGHNNREELFSSGEGVDEIVWHEWGGGGLRGSAGAKAAGLTRYQCELVPLVSCHGRNDLCGSQSG